MIFIENKPNKKLLQSTILTKPTRLTCSELRVNSSPNIQKKSGKYAFDTRIKKIDFIIKLHTYGPSGSFQAPSVPF